MIETLECHQAHSAREPAAVTKASRERLRRMKVTVDAFPVGGRHEDVPEVKMDVYGQFVPLLGLGKMLERGKRLLEVRSGFSVRRLSQRSKSRLTRISDCLLPHLASQGVVG